MAAGGPELVVVAVEGGNSFFANSPAGRHEDLVTRDALAFAEAELRVVPNPHLALRAAREALREDELLCVSGSFYLAGIARRILREPQIRTPEPAPRV